MSKIKAFFVFIAFKICFWLSIAGILFGLRGNKWYHVLAFDWGIKLGIKAGDLKRSGEPELPSWGWS